MNNLITSIKDEKVELCRSLTTSAGRLKQNKMLLFGEEQIMWGLQSKVNFEFILVAQNHQDLTFFATQDGSFLKDKIFFATEGVMKKATETNYLVPCCAVVDLSKSSGSIRLNNSFAVVLDDVVDPGNIGTIIRTANGFGINQFFATSEKFDAYQRKTVDASRGSIFNSVIKNFATPQELISELRNQNYQIVVTSPHAKTLQSQLKLQKKPVALVVGNESSGVCKELFDAADIVVQVPMDQSVESLNVGVFTGISLYELKFKQVLTMLTEKIFENIGRKINVAGMLIKQAFDVELKKVTDFTAQEIIFLMILNCDQKMTWTQALQDTNLSEDEFDNFVSNLILFKLVEQPFENDDSFAISEKGKQLLAEIWPVVEKTESLIFKGFSAEEKQSLHLMLDRMINNLSQSKK